MQALKIALPLTSPPIRCPLCRRRGPAGARAGQGMVPPSIPCRAVSSSGLVWSGLGWALALLHIGSAVGEREGLGRGACAPTRRPARLVMHVCMYGLCRCASSKPTEKQHQASKPKDQKKWSLLRQALEICLLRPAPVGQRGVLAWVGFTGRPGRAGLGWLSPFFLRSHADTAPELACRRDSGQLKERGLPE